MGASERHALAASIASTIADYREGEIDRPTPEHVETWVSQFEGDVQIPLLREMKYVLERTYFTRADVEAFLKTILTSEKLVGDDPASFWRDTEFLDIQGGGHSQSEMLEIFDELLQTQLDVSTAECGNGGGSFAYLDDGIFTGNRVRSDLSRWAAEDAPPEAVVNVICIAMHSGSYYARDRLDEAIALTGKSIKVTWWRAVELENRKRYASSSDVLWPTHLPDDEATRSYAEGLEYEVALRAGASRGDAEFFSGAEGRDLLEQELLKAGVRIRGMAPNLKDFHRPLGLIGLQTLGFGSMLVTYRNCPNNAPLALWVHDPWYPLFKRKTN